MINLSDKKVVNYKNKNTTKYRCSCDMCGVDRGYQVHSRANMLCVACTQYRRVIAKYETIYPNVDFNDYIVSKFGTRHPMSYCPRCNAKKGYRNRVDWGRLCTICSSNDTDRRIRHSCSKRKVPFESFEKFITDSNKLQREEYVRSGLIYKCLKKSSYTCKKCGNRGDLNAHHKNSWHSFPDQRFNLDNLVCLCVPCHREFHSIYGYKNNTEEQIQEYLDN